MATLSIVYLTDIAPSRLAEELSSVGCKVYEALTVSEVHNFCTHQNILAVMIAPSIDLPELKEIRSSYVTLQLRPSTSASDALWELSNLLTSPSRKVL